MLNLPTRFAEIILAFAPLFVHRSWRHAQILLVGAILTPGPRTVTSVLRILGRAQERRFVNVHRILSRAAWCPRSGSRILLGLLVGVFGNAAPWSWDWTTRSSAAAARGSRLRASTVIRFAPPTATSSRRAGCAG